MQRISIALSALISREQHSLKLSAVAAWPIWALLVADMV